MMPFDKHPQMIVWTEDPFNAEPPPELLRREWVTPREIFFARNHAPVPQIDPAAYRLAVGGMVERSLSLSLDELRRNFPARTVTAVLQCAGNRRDELMEAAPIPGEVPWRAGAIGNAEWRGAPLRDVLRAAGVASDASHIAFLGLDEVRKKDRAFGFGGSIPVEKAYGEEVLLAYQMNGEPLPSEHGFPLRVVIPGYIGARSVKWLGSITVQAEPSDNYYQALAYKLFPPHIGPETVDWSQGEMLGELAVSAVICHPAPGARLAAGPVPVRGYAVGGERPLEQVELSVDGGATWHDASLIGAQDQWSWRFWEATLELPHGAREIIARARGADGETQPESVHSVWNFKGYMNNCWHRVGVRVD
ncbi:MAG TPA: molybdopterin-dependent oxidoreductase [Longimicrobiaceae bacterium]|nr:molybdopterin-dependent oxidoreductase [Longimicrobiaceae bacterium]